MWRESNVSADAVHLLCVDCAGKDQNRSIRSITKDGYRLIEGVYTDQIGWLIPAVPTPEGDTYWGYTSVPEEGVNWWKLLPLRKPK